MCGARDLELELAAISSTEGSVLERVDIGSEAGVGGGVENVLLRFFFVAVLGGRRS